MFIDLINNINTLINNIPQSIAEKIDFDFDLYNIIINNENIIMNNINIFDFFNIFNFINKLKNSLNNIHELLDIYIINNLEFHINNIISLLHKYSINLQKDFILFLQNANNTEIISIFNIIDFIDLKHKQDFLNILYNKIYNFNHVYFILKYNYNYDNYFNLLIKQKNKTIGLNFDIINKYDFINNKDFDIKKIILNNKNVNTITSNDFYDLVNKSINNYFTEINSTLIQKKNIQFLNTKDVLIFNDPETLLFNYQFYYKNLKTFLIDNKVKDKIKINTSVFQLML
jgi:hypothetical protein